MKLEQLKKKLPNINISIDYTGTWKDSLQLGLGIVTTGGGLLLTLALVHPVQSVFRLQQKELALQVQV